MYIIFDKNTIINMDNVYSVELGRNEEDTNIYFYSGWDHATVKHSSREQAERNFEQIFTVLEYDASIYKVYLNTGNEANCGALIGNEGTYDGT